MFKKSLHTLIVFGFLAICVPAQANDILVLDMEKVFLNSLAGKDLLKQVKAKGDKIKADRDKAQKELEAVEKKLEEQKNLLTPEALRAKADDLRLQALAKNQEIQQKLRNFETARIAAHSKILTKLTPILQDVMKEKKAQSIIESRVTLISSPDVNVTDIVIKRLNAVLKSVKVKVPSKK